MIELPEALTLAEQMGETLAGKTITEAVVAQSPHGFAWYSAEPPEFREMLIGNKITRAKGVAGNAELFMGERCLSVHDGAKPQYLAPGETEPKKHQLLIRFDDGSSVVFRVQMYGGMSIYKPEENQSPYYRAAVTKPTPLEPGFTKEYFGQIVSDTSPKLSVKALLATEQRIPGLGNGCLQDLLLRAHVHPQSRLSELSSEDFDSLYESVLSTLREMTDKGGRSTEKDFYGNPGGYHAMLSAKTLAYPCMQCGGPVTRKAFLGGNIYFCGHCQPLKK